MPRWEWRAFGDGVAPAARRLGTQAPERTETSDEIYVLSRHSDASVKLRDARVDVKRLVQVAGDGLEQWLPVMKAAFPMAAADVRSISAILGVDAPALDREAYTREEIADEVLGAQGDLLPLPVRKHRAHYAFAGCLAEVSELAIRGRSVRTVAVESEDVDAVRAAVRELGVSALPVVCVPRGLKALAGLGARRYAALDVGTNSVKLHVADVAEDATWQGVLDAAEVTRLGDGLDRTGQLDAAAMERTVAAIAALADEAYARGAVAIAAVGTAGVRAAANGAEFVAAVRARCGIEIDILPGDEEARLAYVAAAQALGPVPGARLVFDSGGGSSQFTFGHGETVVERFSVDVGAVRVTDRYGLAGVTSDEAIGAAFAGIADGLSRLRGRSPPSAIAGMGGTVTNLVAVERGLVAYDPDVVQGATLDRREIDRQIGLYKSCTSEQRRLIAGLQPGRAEVILAGACIVRTVLDLLGHSSLTVSDRGLRHGLIAARFGPNSAWRENLATATEKEQLV